MFNEGFPTFLQYLMIFQCEAVEQYIKIYQKIGKKLKNLVEFALNLFFGWFEYPKKTIIEIR